MNADSITVSVDDLLAKAEELRDEGISVVKLTITGDSYDSELVFEALNEDGYNMNLGNIPSLEYQD